MPAASFDERVEALFRPPLAEMVALSPEGQCVAYTRQAGRQLRIVIMNLDNPRRKRAVVVDPDHDAAVAPYGTPVQLRFMRWATAERLVFAPAERLLTAPPVAAEYERAVPILDGPTIISPILVVDADGRQRGTLVDARDFLETSADARSLADLLRTPKELAATRDEPIRWRMPHLDILGFLPSDREQLILGTHGGFKYPAQYLIDIRTGSVRGFGGNWPSPPGEPQVFDWFRLKVVGERKDAARPTTVWQDDDLGKVQRELELKFPRRVVEIVDWSETRGRVLFRVTGGSDPGRIFIFQRPENLVLEILRRAPWLNASKLNDTRFFEFVAPDGAHLSGYVTWPKDARVDSPPLLLVFPSGFPGRSQPGFDPEAEILADMGFVVARLNHRSVAGVRAEDLTALRTAVDRIAVNDAQAALAEIAARYPNRPFDRTRVATLGRGFGGYLAVRALQLQPAVFRCAIGIDAPLDLRTWLRTPTGGMAPSGKAGGDIPIALIDHEGADWEELSVVDQAEALTNPVFLLVEPARNAAVDVSTSKLRAQFESLGRRLDHLELDPGFAAALPASRAIAYRRFEEFLNLHLHDFALNISPTEEVK